MTWPAALKAVEEATGAPVPELTLPVGVPTRGVELIKRVEEAIPEEDFLPVELGVAVVAATVVVGVAVEVDVGVLVEEGVVMVTGTQFRSPAPRVPEGVAVPAEAWQEAKVVPAMSQDRVPVLGVNVRRCARNIVVIESTYVPLRLMFRNSIEVGAAMAVIPSPAMPQASAATVWGQVIL